MNSKIISIISLVVKVINKFNFIKKDSIIIFSPASKGSLGDQALIQPFLDKYGNSYKISLVMLEGMTPITLKSEFDALFYIIAESRKNKIQFLLTLLHCRSVYVIGADVFDGRYSAIQSSLFLEYADLSVNSGVRAKYVGFSYSKNPNEKVVQHVHRVSEEIEYLLRDPNSHKRFNDEFKLKSKLVADNAFNLKADLMADSAIEFVNWVSGLNSNKFLLGVNVNVLTSINDKENIYKTMAKVIERYLNHSSDRYVVFIPHDYREGQSDYIAHQETEKHISNEFKDRYFMLKNDLNCWDVKAVCQYVDLTLTGRMHLAIATLAQLKPVVCITYVDKFEGLLVHFNLQNSNLLIEPTIAYNGTSLVNDKIEHAIENHIELTNIIESRIGHVKSLSETNLI